MSTLSYERRIVTGQYEHKHASFTVSPEEIGKDAMSAAAHVRDVVHHALGIVEHAVKQEVHAVVGEILPLAAPPLPPQPAVNIAPAVSLPEQPAAAPVAPAVAPLPAPSVSTETSGNALPAVSAVRIGEAAVVEGVTVAGVPEWTKDNVIKLVTSAAARLNAQNKPGNVLVGNLITEFCPGMSPPKATLIAEEKRAEFIARLAAL